MNEPAKPAALRGKVAVVTGSVRGIGQATALAFAADGASVVINGRQSIEAAQASAGQGEAAGGKALIHLADVCLLYTSPSPRD